MENNFSELPQAVYDRLAKMLLPEIRRFYETAEAQQLFEEWKNKEEKTEPVDPE